MVSYVIRTNVSSTAAATSSGAFQLVPAHVTVEIECGASESDQRWSRIVHNQTVVTQYVSSSTSMLPRSEPKPGSFVRCTAQCIDSVDRSRPPMSSASVNLLIEPAPVSNLFMKRINETAVELAWMAPVYFYDYLDMMCYLDEVHLRPEFGQASRKIGERLFPKQTSVAASSRNLVNPPPALVSSTNRYTLGNLIPGAVYNCTLVTVRSVLNFTTRSRGETAYQMTGILKIIFIFKFLVVIPSRLFSTIGI